MRNRIDLTPEEKKLLFTEANRLLTDIPKLPKGQLWQTAQKVLPADRQREIIYNGAQTNLNRQFKAWLKPARTIKGPYVRRAQLSALVPFSLPVPGQPFNYCPGCGFDLRKVKVS
jgi:hypothetical protein